MKSRKHYKDKVYAIPIVVDEPTMEEMKLSLAKANSAAKYWQDRYHNERRTSSSLRIQIKRKSNDD